MTVSLPTAIERYISGKNTADFDTAVSGFSGLAVVMDEGRRYEGTAAIRAWMEETTAKYHDFAVVKSAAVEGDEVMVLADVSGAFPGSPLPFRFRFTLADDRIVGLEIVLAA